jgi:hypothetical protein
MDAYHWMITIPCIKGVNDMTMQCVLVTLNLGRGPSAKK